MKSQVLSRQFLHHPTQFLAAPRQSESIWIYMLFAQQACSLWLAVTTLHSASNEYQALLDQTRQIKIYEAITDDY